MDLIPYFDSFLRYFLVFAVDGDGRDAGMFLCNILLYLPLIFYSSVFLRCYFFSL